jgi:hypothetical protein
VRVSQIESPREILTTFWLYLFFYVTKVGTGTSPKNFRFIDIPIDLSKRRVLKFKFVFYLILDSCEKSAG